MSKIKFHCKVWIGRKDSFPILDVAEPYSVLGDLHNIPNVHDVVAGISKVMEGASEKFTYGWHRCICESERLVTHVTDNHAEYLQTEPYFTVPTKEVYEMLKEFSHFRDDFYTKSEPS